MAAPANPSLARKLLFALFVGAVVAAIGVVVQGFGWNSDFFRDPMLHTALVASAITVALRSPLEHQAQRILGPRGPVALWRAFTVASLVMAVCLAGSLSYVLRTQWSFLSYFTRLWEQEPEFVAIPLAAFVSAAIATRGSTSSAPAIRRTSIAALCVAAALFALAAVRSNRAVAMHEFVSSLSVRAISPAIIVNTSDISGDESSGDPSEPSSSRYQDTVVGALRIRRYSFARRGVCGVLARPINSELPTHTRFDSNHYTTCQQLFVLEHQPSRLLVLTASRERERYGSATQIAIDSDSGTPIQNAAIAGVRERLSLPRSWLVPSAALLLFSCALLLAPSTTRRALQHTHEWSQATLRPDRMIELANGSTVPCPYMLDLEPGPVVITAPTALGAGPFRDAPPKPPERDQLHEGTIAQVFGKLEGAIDAQNSAALCAAAASAAPWIAALIEGLLL